MEWQTIWEMITALYLVVIIILGIFYFSIGCSCGLRQIQKDKDRYGNLYKGKVKFVSCCQAFLMVIAWLPVGSTSAFLCGLSGGETGFFGIDL